MRIAGDEIHHLRHVLRLPLGSEIELIDERADRLFRGRLVSITDDSASAEITEEITKPQINKITLIAGLPKNSVADFITEKVVELGVAKLQFFIAARSQQRLDFNKSERYRRIARAALKQSGYHLFPEISIHPSLNDALLSTHGTALVPLEPNQWRLLLFSPQESSESLGGAAAESLLALANTPELPSLKNSGNITGSYETSGPTNPQLQQSYQNAESYLIVGPEGGLTQEEGEYARRFSYRRVSLGPKTLRTETAAIVACAIVNLLRD